MKRADTTQTLAVVGATGLTVPEIAMRCKKGANGWTSWGILWHDGNFDPALKANLASPSFTGLVQMRNTIAETLRLTAPVSLNAVYQTFYDNAGARVGFIGKDATANNNLRIHADQGEIYLSRSNFAILLSNATGATLNGYTKLGDTAPAIKQKKLTGTTPAAENGTVSLAHGLTSTKIISVTAIVHSASGAGILPGYTRAAEYQYDVSYDGANVIIGLSATNSGNILSKAITVLITYEE